MVNKKLRSAHHMEWIHDKSGGGKNRVTAFLCLKQHKAHIYSQIQPIDMIKGEKMEMLEI